MTTDIPGQRVPQPKLEIVRETYYKAMLPGGRKAELRNETFTVWTRGGEELQFTFADVRAMVQMMDQWKADRSGSGS